MHQLTERQLQLGRLIAKGLTYNEIAKEMGITPSTAKSNTTRLRWILGVEKKRHIPEVMRQLGLIK